MTKFAKQLPLPNVLIYGFNDPLPPEQVIPVEVIAESAQATLASVYGFLDGLNLEFPSTPQNFVTDSGLTVNVAHERVFPRISDVDIPPQFHAVLSQYAQLQGNHNCYLPDSLIDAYVASNPDAFVIDLENPEEWSDIPPAYYTLDVMGYTQWLSSVIANRVSGWRVNYVNGHDTWTLDLKPDGKRIQGLNISQRFDSIPFRNFKTQIRFNGSQLSSLWHEAPNGSLFPNAIELAENYYPFWVGIDRADNFHTKRVQRVQHMRESNEADWEHYLQRVRAGEPVMSGQSGKWVVQSESQALNSLQRWRDHFFNVYTQVLYVRRSSRPPYAFRGELGYKAKDRRQQEYVSKNANGHQWLAAEQADALMRGWLEKGLFAEYVDEYGSVES